LNRRGFTLIELLMSVTMLAVIIGIMGGALSLAYQTSEKAERKIDALERKKMIFSLVESQIQSAFVSVYADQGETKNRFSGAGDTVTFASNYSIWRGTRGNCLVTYHVEMDNRRRSIFRIAEQIMGTDAKQETSVKTDYEAIRFEYYYEDATEEARWVDEWPAEEKAMPQKIRIHFSGDEGNSVLTARIMTQMSASAAGAVSNPVPVK